ncbi:hypothetical protein HQ587_08165 [bacterium]|nr:hypothetical protein [bacterium]
MKYLIRMNSTTTAVISAVICLLLLSGCSDPISTPIPDPHEKGLNAVVLDSIWIVNSEWMHTISISVYPPNIAAGREMLCQIRSEQVSTHFRLYDDGSYGRWEDAAGFADSISGDQIPGNAVYTRRINSLFAIHEGEYHFLFALSGGEPPDTLEMIITLSNNSLPQIFDIEYPDSVLSGVMADPFNVVVADSNGLDDIVRVELLLGEWFDRQHLMTYGGENTWELGASSVAARLPTGEHPFCIRVYDHYLNQIHQPVASDYYTVWLENLPPRVTEVAGPDTVWLPETGSDTFEYRIIVNDDQGVGDLGGLELVLSDTAGVILERTYFDDGSYPGSIAGDWKFHAGFTVVDTAKTGILYTFAWTPTDLSPQSGETYYNTLIFMPPRENMNYGRYRTKPLLTAEERFVLY